MLLDFSLEPKTPLLARDSVDEPSNAYGHPTWVPPTSTLVTPPKYSSAPCTNSTRWELNFSDTLRIVVTNSSWVIDPPDGAPPTRPPGRSSRTASPAARAVVDPRPRRRRRDHGRQGLVPVDYVHDPVALTPSVPILLHGGVHVVVVPVAVVVDWLVPADVVVVVPRELDVLERVRQSSAAFDLTRRVRFSNLCFLRLKSSLLVPLPVTSSARP